MTNPSLPPLANCIQLNVLNTENNVVIEFCPVLMHACTHAHTISLYQALTKTQIITIINRFDVVSVALTQYETGFYF